MNPRYPVYIISKNRWDKCKTSIALEKMNVPHKVVVEPVDYDKYAEHIDESRLSVLPSSDLGQGSIPARNWVWDDAISNGAKRHWILDDNIGSFCRYNCNKRVRVKSGTIFRCAEDFVDRYKNVAISGFQYRCFANNFRQRPAFIPNTRIYSCLLIKNDIPYRWRGMYNEDTDLSLRALKDGWCTILFNAFLQDKAGTMTMKGGNTDELYKDDGRLKMAESLVEQHPDVVKITFNKWGRPQHLVNYKPFKKNKLERVDGLIIKEEINEYGMILRRIPKDVK